MNWTQVGRSRHEGRSPRGERGLKWFYPWSNAGRLSSLPSRGARVEIVPGQVRQNIMGVAPLAGSEG